MPDASKTIIDLETKFWQSMVDDDSETVISLVAEPAVMVSGHGAFQFTRDQYKKMAREGPVVVTSFKFEDMKVLFPNDSTAVVTYKATQGVAPRGKKEESKDEVVNDTSTWVKDGGDWKCVMHTETPVIEKSPKS